jgi:hypothetical protein
MKMKLDVDFTYKSVDLRPAINKVMELQLIKSELHSIKKRSIFGQIKYSEDKSLKENHQSSDSDFETESLDEGRLQCTENYVFKSSFEFYNKKGRINLS